MTAVQDEQDKGDGHDDALRELARTCQNPPAPDAAGALLAQAGEAIDGLLDEVRALRARLAAAQRDIERWAPVEGFNGLYEVSTKGRVRSHTRVDSTGKRRKGQYLTPTRTGRGGYLVVNLSLEAERFPRYVQRLVAETFLPNPEGLPRVLLKDEDPANPELGNLEWTTASEVNARTRRTTPYVSGEAIYGLSIEDGSRIDFASKTLAARAGFVAQMVRACIRGTREHYKGYRWFSATDKK